MIDPFELYKDFNAINNTSQNGFWRPEKDFERNMNEASMRLWNNKIDESEKSDRIIDDLSPFFISKNIIVKNQNSFYGTIDKPTTKGQEYGRWGNARMIIAGNITVPCKDVDQGKCCNGTLETDQELANDYYDTVKEIQIEKIANQRWPGVLNHLTHPPSLKNPKLTQINNQFQVAPRQVSVVVLDYYIKPTWATFKYTTSVPNLINGSGDEIIYNKAASTSLQWPINVKNELLEILKDIYIGFSRDSQYQQINASQKQTP